MMYQRKNPNEKIRNIPLNIREVKSNTKTIQETKTILKQKRIFEVYINEEKNKKYISAATAYSLGLTKVRDIMLSPEKRLFEITETQLSKISSRGDIEFKYIKLNNEKEEKNENVIKNNYPKYKKIIRVYTKEDELYIDTATAFALGYIDNNKFNNKKDGIYKITKEQFNSFEGQFEIETIDLNDNTKSNNM